MESRKFTESVVEEAALAWLEAKGWTVLHGPEIAAGMPLAERDDPDYRDVVLERRLRQSLQRRRCLDLISPIRSEPQNGQMTLPSGHLIRRI